MPPPRKRAARYTTARLQAQIVAERAMGEPAATVARRHELAPRTVRDILQRARAAGAEAEEFARAARAEAIRRATGLVAEGLLTVTPAALARLGLGERIHVLHRLSQIVFRLEGGGGVTIGAGPGSKIAVFTPARLAPDEFSAKAAERLKP